MGAGGASYPHKIMKAIKTWLDLYTAGSKVGAYRRAILAFVAARLRDYFNAGVEEFGRAFLADSRCQLYDSLLKAGHPKAAVDKLFGVYAADEWAPHPADENWVVPAFKGDARKVLEALPAGTLRDCWSTYKTTEQLKSSIVSAMKRCKSKRTQNALLKKVVAKVYDARDVRDLAAGRKVGASKKSTARPKAAGKVLDVNLTEEQKGAIAAATTMLDGFLEMENSPSLSKASHAATLHTLTEGFKLANEKAASKARK